jgi:hypothetical protein
MRHVLSTAITLAALTLVGCAKAPLAVLSATALPGAEATGRELLALPGQPPARPVPARQARKQQFRLEVRNGYGSGVYTAGDTVHLWSAVSTTDGVALPWRGDASALKAPKEWHTTMVMPARDVTLTANGTAQALKLNVDHFLGATNVSKTVRYYFPPAMRGVVLFSHGTGGSSTFIESTEAFAIALALVRKGYGVIGTECEEAASGNPGPDGKARWNASRFATSNVDLQNLEVLFAGLERKRLIPAGTPKYALGMSNGGAQSLFLGAVSASKVARDFPSLRFRAVVSYCADGSTTKAPTLSTTPSAWYMAGAEDHPEVSNAEAKQNSQVMGQRGVPTEYLENPPSPMYNERFSRIAGISPETSTAMVQELRAAGFIDADGFVNTDGDVVAKAVADNPSGFPVISEQKSPGAVRSQIKAVRAEHAMYADLTQRTIDWFERFNSRR